jgi:hypothetical protein
MTGAQLGLLLRQRRYASLLGNGTNAISLDGGASWWEFYLEDREFAIGGPIDHTQPAREEWNPMHAGLSYSVIEVRPGTDDSLLIVRFGYPESPCFVFKARYRQIQLVLINAKGEMSDAGVSSGHTLDRIEYVGRTEVVLPLWQSQPLKVLRIR